MNVNLTPELEKLVHDKVASGRYNSASEVIRESLRLLEDFERVKLDRHEQLRREIDIGLQQANAGRVRTFDAERIKRRVRKSSARSKKGK